MNLFGKFPGFLLCILLNANSITCDINECISSEKVTQSRIANADFSVIIGVASNNLNVSLINSTQISAVYVSSNKMLC